MKKKWQVTGQTGLRQQVNRVFRQGPELRRDVFAAAQRVRHLSTWQSRRAARIDAPAAAAIPWDRGFTIAAPGQVPGADGVVVASLEVLEQAGDFMAKARKRFLANALNASELSLSSPFLRFALDPRVLRPIVEYLGLVPVLTNISVFSSAHSGEDLKSSQLLHCDADDTRQVKIFILCSPVAAANGPLTILPADVSRRIRQKVDYRFGGRVSDEDAAQVPGGSAGVPLVGDAGTLCFLDTSRCFHFGSRVEAGAQPRLVTMIQYLTPFAFTLPANFKDGAPFRHLAGSSTDPVQRMVLGAS